MSLEEPNNFIEWYVIRQNIKLLIKQSIIELYSIDKKLLDITNNILIYINKKYNLNISYIYFIGQYRAFIEDCMVDIMYMEYYNNRNV
jgi:hypothetical protein